MAKKILVETSARHVHLTDEHLKVLFGADAVLHKKKDLSQPGQFACEERVDVVGPKKTLARVSVLGPTRKLVGPCGEVELTEGVIVAMRHIHTTPEDAAELGVTNGEVVSLKVDTQERNLIFGDVVVRVSPNYATVVHIDTDEANAANCKGEVYGEIVK